MNDKIKQYHGIKFPFTINNQDGLFIDLNNDYRGSVASEILHTILTQKGTRLRMPEFGTNLMKYVFEPSDEITWSDIEGEISSCIEQYVPGAKINKINIVRDENNDNDVFLELKYSVIKGMSEENNKMVVKL